MLFYIQLDAIAHPGFLGFQGIFKGIKMARFFNKLNRYYSYYYYSATGLSAAPLF